MRRFVIGAIVSLAALVAVPAAVADGTETLGPPSVSIATGTGIVVAGLGNEALPNLPGSFTVSVPAGATVKQVLLYWEGHHSSPFAASGDDSITINGIPVTGTLIGGPTAFFTQAAGPSNQTEMFSTYRADITGLGFVSAGANTLTVTDMLFQSNFPTGFPFNQGNDGVGVLVVYDAGGTAATIGVRDGLDMAYKFFAPPLDATVPQTFTFPPSTSARTANLVTLAGSVKGPDDPRNRGNVLWLTFDVGGSIMINDPWQSNQGSELDAVNTSITVPAGASSLTVQAVSEGPFDAQNQPASFAWSAAALSVPPGQQDSGGALTPGYWKNHMAPSGDSECKQLGKSGNCSKNGPWTKPNLPQTLGSFSVGTIVVAGKVFDLMNCGSSKNQDAVGCLAGHLLATKLNVANGASTCISGTIAAADTFLAGVGYSGPSWSGTLNAAQRATAIALKDALDKYNNDMGCS
jgi:hypothetical protein